jgi:hypothetical protein
MLQLLDTDGDGSLAAEEIQASSSALLKCDRNGDGTLSPDELGRGGGEGRGEHGRGGPPPGNQGPRGPGAQGPGLHGPPNPPALGDVLPPHVRHHLQLNETQTAELRKLEEEVKSRLTSLLDAEQRSQAEELLHERPGPPPGGPGEGPPRRGRRGPGGPPRPGGYE